MDKEKDKKQKTVKTDYSSKKRVVIDERETGYTTKAAEALNGFLKNNIID